jgi:lysylphosphatidylglycerol synthetase-like protein (DUF2156 family)
MKGLYLGDEAVVATASFSLEGRAIRKVRQSDTRLRKLCYRAELRALATLTTTELAELECVSATWSLADAVFQIERLYHFNAKFFPRWEPRYLMYEHVLSLPRVGLAALWAEGQLPKPALRR